MKKKAYIAPEAKVTVFEVKNQILAGSGDGILGADDSKSLSEEEMDLIR